jgi:ABC-type hemin transport system substrate-binding protein
MDNKLDQDTIKDLIDDVSSFIASPQNDQVLKQVIEDLIKDLQDEVKNVTPQSK